MKKTPLNNEPSSLKVSGVGQDCLLAALTEPEEPAEILFRVALPGRIEPFIIFCLFPFETDGREL